jgi:molybdopterin converting factor small subunit
MPILYFGRLREVFATDREPLPSPLPATAADLLDSLRARGGVWTHELAPGKSFRVAIDQSVVSLDAPLREGAEVALFPPVTGG